MMDAQVHAAAASRLNEALEQAGVAVERGSFAGGNLVSWDPVPGAAILGRLMQISGWRIRLVEPAEAEVVGNIHLVESTGER